MINRVTLLGRLGRDPEIRTTQGGIAVATLSIATDRRVKDRESGEWTKATDWHRAVAFKRTAEVAGQYLAKGSLCCLEGRLQTRNWQDAKTGEQHYITEVIVEHLTLLDRRRGDDGEEPRATSSRSTSHDSGPAAEDDDIPF